MQPPLVWLPSPRGGARGRHVFEKKPAEAKKEPWPASLPEQIKGFWAALLTIAKPAAAKELAARFSRAKADDVQELLETLVVVGQARLTEDGRFVAV